MMDRNSEVTLPAGAPEFVIARRFAAPRALVWKCWMEPSHLARWFGPKNFTCPVCEVDSKSGGKFRIVMRGKDGTDYPITGTFLDIVPLERIVKEEDTSEHSEEWHDLVDPDRKGQGRRKIPLLTTVTFAGDGGSTLVTVRTEFPSVRIRDNFVKAGMDEGWSSSLEKLEDLLDAVKQSDHTITITRLFAAPVARVFSCFGDAADISRWWGPNGFTTTTYEKDFRVGGHWHYTMHGPDGTDYPNFVRYTDIVPNRRIAYDHGAQPNEPEMFKADIRFEEEAGKTRVTLQLTIADPAQRDKMIAFGAVEGGWQTLSRLAAYLEA
jgi:uncharacterized protein YndB with AHSA1/START domain